MIKQQISHHNVLGGAVAYAWSHGPVANPLIMLHGLGDSAITTFKPRLSQSPLTDTPVLFIDLPGFGESRYTPDHAATIARYASDVAGVLTMLNIEHASVFGHSMGGNIAIQLAHDYPHLVDRLIVAEALLEAGQSVLAAGIIRFSEEAFVNRRYPTLVRATSLQAHRGDVAAAAFLPPLHMADPVAMYRAAASLLADGAATTATILVNLPIPRTFLLGETTISVTSVLESAQIRVSRIPGAGHNMLVEQAFSTTCAILEAMI